MFTNWIGIALHQEAHNVAQASSRTWDMRLEAQARSYVCAYDRHPPQITCSRGQGALP